MVGSMHIYQMVSSMHIRFVPDIKNLQIQNHHVHAIENLIHNIHNINLKALLSASYFSIQSCFQLNLHKQTLNIGLTVLKAS